MAEAGVELIVGLRRDASFGPAVVVGLGGVLTELLDDVAIRLAPVDRGAVAALVVALSRLGDARPDIVEVDLNPVIASAQDALAVDALVVLAAPPALAGPEVAIDV